jgi:hypothetical protein
VGLINETEREWSGCDVLLQKSAYKLPAHTNVKPGKLQWFNVKAAQRPAGADPRVETGTALVRCAEGEGVLPLSE